MSSPKQVAEKLQTLEIKLSSAPTNKSFKFFALLLREDVQKWDLVVSATWLDTNQLEGLKFLVAQIRQALTEDEFLMLSRIVPHPTTSEIPAAFARAINAEHGLIEIKDSNFFGFNIKEAYIITSH